MSRTFDLYSILAITHRLPATGVMYREIVEYMTAEVFAGPGQAQALGAIDPCREALFEQHPQLHRVPSIPFFDDDEQAMDDWCDSQKAALGVTSLPVEPLTPGTWQRGDVTEGIVDMRGSAQNLYTANPNKPGWGLNQ